ncbi:Gfo/Idh/MocA family protein [Rhodopirellula sallentina]|uniref:Oxidoreductase domain-containing protein n=1 Tax=Rhodopirellula sallentina SM41 TaxID=1263870 RepID=M5TRE6_9BACT|nr:Gfo/Idh/MocA family oxidoreductase [Rhodopirellula sallentina]EMI51747.1 oxidoreductase domain-containing protein [Rhodopirellula sallentina SM41]
MTVQRNRRDLLKATGIAATGLAAAPAFVPAHLFGKNAPSNRITMGFIGVGLQGHGVNLKMFLEQSDCRAVAVCDVKPEARQRAAKSVNNAYGNQDCFVTDDFREILQRDDIDAVCISTPDHWHVPMSTMALEAGKDVISEKPTLTIQEGRELVDVVKKTGRVFTVGLEDRSLPRYHKLAEVVRNGGIGKLHTIHVGLPYKSKVWQKLPESPVPKGMNYRLWLGPAPYAPYCANRTHPQCWRQIEDYAAGVLTDWGMHLCDTAQVANFSENTSPVKVEGVGEIPENALNSVPNKFELTYTFANGVVMHVKSTKASIRFEGSDGWCGNNKWNTALMSDDHSIFDEKYTDNKMWPRPPREQRNFLDCVRFGAKPNYDAEALHRLSTTLLIGSIAMKLKRPLQWDPEREEFIDDAEANAMRSRPRSNEWMNF